MLTICNRYGVDLFLHDFWVTVEFVFKHLLPVWCEVVINNSTCLWIDLSWVTSAIKVGLMWSSVFQIWVELMLPFESASYYCPAMQTSIARFRMALHCYQQTQRGTRWSAAASHVTSDSASQPLARRCVAKLCTSVAGRRRWQASSCAGSMLQRYAESLVSLRFDAANPMLIRYILVAHKCTNLLKV